MSRCTVALLASALLATGCGVTGCGGEATPRASTSETPGHPPETGAYPGEASHSPVPRASGPPVRLEGWEVTVYYTAVETLHTGQATTVTGCPSIDCDKDRDRQRLGSFPASFVKAVKDEGTGRTADGRYLNWSYDTGYWMDTAPRDTAGRPLRPWSSAAADGAALGAGTQFTILHCGTAEVAAEVCAKLKTPTWTIVDEFTPGLGGERHVDVYIGEETGPDFTGSDLYTTLENATLSAIRA
ncbi:hypothetical protein ABT297_11185 [Dactylosporangium sp. NPDC000555]|uniref:hypothetical protein n=1 Tax=Dactylosporangium sp. NPDC000555 TaxID=3154260 RepID=UPI003317D5E2